MTTRRDLEQMYVALTLGARNLRDMTRTSSGATTEDLLEAAQHVEAAAQILGRSIDPQDISIIER